MSFKAKSGETIKATIGGSEYKLGRFGFVYRWSDVYQEWIKSEKEPREVTTAYNKSKRDGL